MLPRALRLVVFAAIAVAAVGCSQPTPARRDPPGPPEVVFRPPGAAEVRVVVEIARTERERNRGLMYRDKLESGRGMLFLFEEAAPLSFWMRNTYIPLDMIFLGADRRVVGIVERAEPLTDDPRGVPGRSQFVVEVPGGWAAAHRIAPGTPVDFRNID